MVARVFCERKLKKKNKTNRKPDLEDIWLQQNMLVDHVDKDVCIHARTHTRVHARTHAHTHTHTHTPVYICTQAHTRTDACMPTKHRFSPGENSNLKLLSDPSLDTSSH